MRGSEEQGRARTISSGEDAAARPVWLVGMMGAGKSTLGPLVAKALARPFVDTDDAIVEAAGRSVEAIFEAEGEAGFRERERAAIADAGRQAAVAALGGGAIAQPGAPERLAALGTVVYLRAQVATLMARIGDGAQRPLLAGLSRSQREERVAQLLAEREAAYLSARLVVDVDSWEAGRIAARIADGVRAIEAGRESERGGGNDRSGENR